MTTNISKSLEQTVFEVLQADANPISIVAIVAEKDTSLVLHEGKWIPGKFDRNIRIDQPTHVNGGDKMCSVAA